MQKEIITFKIDKDLSRKLAGIENRSRFIREAVLESLENACPFCRGTGVLTPHRKKHWESFAHGHTERKCGQCNETQYVCKKSSR